MKFNIMRCMHVFNDSSSDTNRRWPWIYTDRRMSVSAPITVSISISISTSEECQIWNTKSRMYNAVEHMYPYYSIMSHPLLISFIHRFLSIYLLTLFAPGPHILQVTNNMLTNLKSY